MAFGLIQAHATMMIVAWMTLGPTGILFARYGRSLRFGTRRQFLGKALWFQIHRFLLSITPLLTLVGFFFILAFANGRWVDYQLYTLRFVHSIFGIIIVCCVIIQVWLALYRCNPRSRFRYMFDWSHRITGSLAFILSIPTIFVIVFSLIRNRIALITVISLWTGWIIIIILIFEKIECQQRNAIAAINGRGEEVNQNNSTATAPVDIESTSNTNYYNRRLTIIKFILLLLNVIVSTTLSISFIVIFSS
jgi:hypothetical protein